METQLFLFSKCHLVSVLELYHTLCLLPFFSSYICDFLRLLFVVCDCIYAKISKALLLEEGLAQKT